MRLKDLTGETFSRLTVIERAESAPNGNARWLCQCSCGRQVVVDSYRLRKGITKSCGYGQMLVERIFLKIRKPVKIWDVVITYRFIKELRSID